MKQTELTTMLTVEEAHEMLGVDKISLPSLYNAINRGEIPHVRVGKRILIPRAGFLRWLDPTAEKKTSDARLSA